MRSPVQKDGPILIVDDDHDIRVTLAGILEEAGYLTMSAENGYEALACMRRAPPALILLDIMMPLMNGIQFRIETMKNPGWREIPVMVMTAKSQEELKQQGMELEGTILMRKPFELPALLALAEQWVKRSPISISS